MASSRFGLTHLGGIALIPVGLYWVFLGFPGDIGVPEGVVFWLITLPYEAVGLVVLGAAVGALLGRVNATVAGAVLGSASAAWCLTREILTTERERAVVTPGFAHVESTWWLSAVVVCGGVAGLALLASPRLRADNVPTGGPTARTGLLWAALTIACLQLVYLVSYFGVASTLESHRVILPPTAQSATMVVLWLGCAVVAAVPRGLWPVLCAVGLAAAATVVQIVFDAQSVVLGIPGVSDLRVWMGVALVVAALVCLWVLPLARGWTPATRRQLADRPKGVLD